ncbi:hypothetical protein [Stutzerimonas tarimensis]|uniref:Uncharacterized protein n=1 Tax=Stutzerimonas tarimensis TaxID=1507735 RepID=A0ABV7T8N9_9GAMM
MTKSDDQITGYGGQPKDLPSTPDTSPASSNTKTNARANVDAASEDVKNKAKDVGQDVKHEAHEVADDLKHEAQDLTEQAKREGMSQVDKYRSTAADELERVARSAKVAAEDLESDRPGLSHYVSDMAQNMVDFADDLRGKSVDQLLGDVNRMARQNPALFVLGSIAVGFGVTRFAKASSRHTASDYADSSLQDRSHGNGMQRSDSSMSGAPPFQGDVDRQKDLNVDFSKGIAGSGNSSSGSSMGASGGNRPNSGITTGSTLDAPTGSTTVAGGGREVPIKTDPRTRAGNAPTNFQRDN